MQWLVFALLVVGSSVASFVARERRFRRRWQNVELPAITVGHGAYRAGPASGAMMPSAPLALRVAALSCLVYGRGVTTALVGTALYHAGVPLRGLAEATLHGLVGYLAGGYGFGALAAIVLAALALAAGNDLLLRNHRHAFQRTRNIALASLALHGLVWANITFHGHIVASTARNVADSLAYARSIAAVAFGHAALMLALAYAYRAQLSALSPAERKLDL
ncbi:MAG: hypothetical protein JWM10_159 [Myxococcaceae bacterium]|nr:hypothetical protein [Myxococcaceae bacterium]